jgi:hypothetical protein
MQAIAAASVKCTTTGNAWACAYAEAKAEQWASANAFVHAEAVAAAETLCSECNVQTAVATIASTDFFKKVYVDAVSHVAAGVCVDGDDDQAAYIKCTSKAIAYQFAIVRSHNVISDMPCGLVALVFLFLQKHSSQLVGDQLLLCRHSQRPS